MKHKIPESFYIYQELVSKLALQKAQLKQQYELKIEQLSIEMSALLQHIEEQNNLLENSKEYIQQLEERLNKKRTV